MRDGVGDSSTWTTALASTGIRTGWLARFDFASGSIYAWTGGHPLPVSGTGDTLCDGHTFEPINEGVLLDIGANSFSYSGSEPLILAMAIPDPPTDAMIGALGDNDEWQGRMCILWRVVFHTAATATAASQYVVKRVRAGAMDELRVTNDGQSHRFTLTVEAHASMISKATNGTYLDQKTRYDSTDTSQDYAVDIANDPRYPSRGGSGDGRFIGNGWQGVIRGVFGAASPFN